jgi:hypothetical protein
MNRAARSTQPLYRFSDHEGTNLNRADTFMLLGIARSDREHAAFNTYN